MTAKKKSSTAADKVLVRSAKIRAAIMALARNKPGITTPEVMTELAALIEEEKINTTTINTQLKSLVKNGQLVTEPGHRPLRYAHPGKLSSAEEQGDVVVKQKKGAVPTFTIDVVKSTGRVRLQLAGLSIEIGVVDK